MTEELARLLGNIEGKLDMVIDGQDEVKKQINGLDGRLRRVENKSILNGALSGGIVSIGVALMIEKGKSTLGL